MAVTLSPQMSRCQSSIEGNFIGADGPASVRGEAETEVVLWGRHVGAMVGKAGEDGGGWGRLGGGGRLERTPQTTKLVCSSSWVWSWSRRFN